MEGLDPPARALSCKNAGRTNKQNKVTQAICSKSWRGKPITSNMKAKGRQAEEREANQVRSHELIKKDLDIYEISCNGLEVTKGKERGKNE